MKDVVLDGMNGFRGLVQIKTFDLPANDPAGGISLTLQTSLTCVQATSSFSLHR